MGETNRDADDAEATVADARRRLDHEETAVRVDAAWSLAETAAEHPGRVMDAVPALAGRLDDPDDWIRRGVAWAIAEVAAEHPSAAKQVLSPVVAALDDDDRLVRESMVYTVADLAAVYPRSVGPALAKLVSLTEDEDRLVRRYAADALSYLTESAAGLSTTYPELTELEGGLPTGGDVHVFGIKTDGFPESASAHASGGPSAEVESPDPEPDPGPPRGPPDEVPETPPRSLSFSDLEPTRTLSAGRNLRVEKAHFAGPRGEQVVTRKTVRAPPSPAESGFDAAFADALRRWADVSDHDHVATVVDWGTRPRHWLVVEHLDAGTLAARIGAMGFDERLWVARSLVRALDYAHGRGVVHLGVRPGAVRFVEPLSHSWPVPKLTDWGLQHLVRSHHGGDPAADPYAAPEQVDASYGAPDQLTDVYRLGAVCYELFTGRLPHSKPQKVDRFERPVPPATSRNSSLPAALDPVLSRALATRRTERYETVADFRRDLDVLVESEANFLAK